MNAELVLDAQATLGEGPVWHARSNRLFWVDIDRHLIHEFDPKSGDDRTYDAGSRVGAVAVQADDRDSGLPECLMMVTDHGYQRIELESGKISLVGDPESDLSENRFNDGKCDPRGRFWAGTICLDKEAREGGASLYRLDQDGSIRRMLRDVSNSNGLGWSPDQQTMYHIDTPTLEIAAYNYSVDTGAVSGRRVITRLDGTAGRPDGMTVDAEGMLWVAHWAGARVTRWSPTGDLLDTIQLPALNVTSCQFGGPDLSTLYITTARAGLSDRQLAQQPQAGGLFAVQTETQGTPMFEFVK